MKRYVVLDNKHLAKLRDVEISSFGFFVIHFEYYLFISDDKTGLELGLIVLDINHFNSRVREFEDDETALLWFKLNY